MAYLGDAAVYMLLFSGWCAVLSIAGGIEYLWEIRAGIEPAPRWMTRRYWHRKLCRVVCRLADLETAWEQRKIPRKAATSHGIVGQRVRKAEYGYIKIVPQTDPRVKGLRVEKLYRR